jgi:hypothetical protein
MMMTKHRTLSRQVVWYRDSLLGRWFDSEIGDRTGAFDDRAVAAHVSQGDAPSDGKCGRIEFGQILEHTP